MKNNCPKCGREINSKDCCRTGKFHYLFNWIQGGYNDTHADSPEDAIRKANLGNKNLAVAPGTVRIYTYEDSERENRRWGPYD